MTDPLTVRVPSDKTFEWTITGEQIRLLLAIIEASTFRGSQTFLVAKTIDGLQKLVLPPDTADKP